MDSTNIHAERNEGAYAKHELKSVDDKSIRKRTQKVQHMVMGAIVDGGDGAY
jgi:hypothetical protein